MPHLDANALTTDVEGLAFLQDVIATTALAPARPTFEAVRPTKRPARLQPLDVADLERPSRRRRAVIQAA